MAMTTLDPVHFLLVDDLEGNLVSLEALLQREGLVLLKANSGKQALELLLKYEVALALLDVQMPDMDGFELAELMRGTERTRRVPIIFLTAGNADRQRRFRGYEAGAVDFLHKPIEADILRSKADVFFELYRHQQQVAKQRDELKLATEALRDADRRKDEFLATLAHELRNPLAPIGNGLKVLRMSPDEDVAHQVQDMMERQLNHLVRLIDDLLDVSRVSQGKIDLRKEQISIQAALQAAIEASRQIIEERKHTLALQVPDEPLWLNADLTRMAQVISNLLNNSAKYTPEGGKILLSIRHINNEVIISVSDNGLGISRDMLPKIFDLFTQVDVNLERTQGGLGIGLSLVKRLVEMHGGTIYAESKGINYGSTFTIRIPLIQLKTPPPAKENTAADDIDSPPATLRVLVVDDNIASAKTAGWMLEMIGHEYHLAHDGLEALAAAIKLRPDVILLDIGLPGMNGYEVCRELRNNPLFKDTVFIAQTGWGQERDRREAYAAGFNHHMIKPINFEQFSGLLASIKPMQSA